jgi:hypothetical protein
LIAALVFVLERLDGALRPGSYCLVGTASAVIRGVDLPAGDVDILLRERSSVDTFAAALSDLPVRTPPTLLEEARQYFAAYDVGGVPVEASTVEWETDSDCVETLGEGPWRCQERIPCGPYHIPAVALELRLAIELLRDRPDRYGPLLDWLRRNGCDTALFRRAMAARRLPREVQVRALGVLERHT